MNLQKHYDTLFQDSLQTITKHNFTIDPNLDNPDDDRFGLTLLIRPPAFIKKRIQEFLQQLRQIEPLQYYYPDSDLHITVLSIISCTPGFSLDQIEPKQYVEIIRDVLASQSSFNIHLKGVTLSPSSVLIQGFYPSGSLDSIRDELRIKFKESGLKQSIDRRYRLVTAHITSVRFRHPVKEKNLFLKKVNQYREYDLGSFSVNSLELVFNDWYQRKGKIFLLQEFPILNKFN